MNKALITPKATVVDTEVSSRCSSEVTWLGALLAENPQLSATFGSPFGYHFSWRESPCPRSWPFLEWPAPRGWSMSVKSLALFPQPRTALKGHLPSGVPATLAEAAVETAPSQPDFHFCVTLSPPASPSPSLPQVWIRRTLPNRLLHTSVGFPGNPTWDGRVFTSPGCCLSRFICKRGVRIRWTQPSLSSKTVGGTTENT